jgi:hypothetical protein
VDDPDDIFAKVPNARHHPLFKIARAFVCFYQVPSVIINVDRSIGTGAWRASGNG